MQRKTITTISLLFILGYASPGQTSQSSVSPDELKAHVSFLASDALQGRASGSEANREAAEYIAKLLKQYSIAPAGDNGTYFQTFSFVSSLTLGTGNALSFLEREVPGMKWNLALDSEYRPLSFSLDSSVTAPLVFAGYGISAPALHYDDYADIDVTGKVVAVLRYGPEGKREQSQFSRFTSLRNKARIAREKGAVGLIVFAGPEDDAEDEPVKLSYDQSPATSGIVAVSAKRSALEPLFNRSGWSLKALQDSINSSRKPITFPCPGVLASLRTDIVAVRSNTANVAGVLAGSDEKLKQEYIVLGAHLDHLGRGGPGSGSLAPDTVAVHHGADDNASGTAGLLALARLFGGHASSLKRSLLFLFFSGEELGTLGSLYYVNHPSVPLQRTRAMLNLDMIGRLSDRTLTVYGTGTSPEWNDLLAGDDSASTFTLKKVADGYAPSDQSSFYARGIPVLFFFTGFHPDYHRPSDTWDKLNYQGEVSVLRLVHDIAAKVDTQAGPVQFTAVQSSERQGSSSRRSFAVTLGIVPDYGETARGVTIAGIRPNGPAQKAGLRTGDTIVMLAGKNVLNIYEYMDILGELKAGDTVGIRILRDGSSVDCTAVMEKPR